MKTLLFALGMATVAAPTPVSAALTDQYVSYTFSGYPGEDDPYFPSFTLYTADFLTDPDPAAFSARRSYSATSLVSSNNVASVAFEWGGTVCCGLPARPSYVTIYQRFAYPGQSQFGGFVPTDQAGVRSNGRFIWTVSLLDGSIPSFIPQITQLVSFPGAWETPIGGTSQIDPTAIPPSNVPEPSNWALMIVGFALVGVQLRRLVRVESVSA